MGLNESKKYIKDLHKKQDNPYLWPDFLTGLPDKAAIIKKVSEVHKELGKYRVTCVRIANVQPYLIKYGPDRHADVIQWAAAILKTTADKYKGFVGACCTHDFIVVSDKKNADRLMKDASGLFDKIALSFYSKEDLDKGTVLSFVREGKKVDIGFMRLVAKSMTEDIKVPKEHIIPYLGKLCSQLEQNI